MNILIIGGTRNLGFYTSKRLIADGHRVTLLNRGLSEDDLPESVHRLRCDRTDIQQMRRALNGRHFDMVIDMVVYSGQDAEDIIQILDGQIGHYVFISTGQVYLVREGSNAPIHENEYDGELVTKPEDLTYDYEEWLYGVQKREAENVLAAAYAKTGFPYTSLRLPMVNSQRDGFNRLYSYVLRIKDGGPMLVPDQPNYPLRHVYVGDVVQAIVKLIETGKGKGAAYNISQDETVSLNTFVTMLADILNRPPNIVEVERRTLQANGFLPDCSPFSEAWMSVLDNTRSKEDLGMTYTPLRTYLEKILAYYEEHPPMPPVSYRRRQAEKNMILPNHKAGLTNTESS